mgnify:CR=1 FL=1
MKYQCYLPTAILRQRLGLSERSLAESAALSRSCVRQIVEHSGNLTIRSFVIIAEFFGRSVEVLTSSDSANTDFSVQASSYKISRDGFDSWKIHIMDFVDEFRRSLDARLILLPPTTNLDPRLSALFASLTRYLCDEVQMSCPAWATKRYSLPAPWFPSGVESLKASALLESPLAFRSNNIFVQNNFANRA